MGASRRGECSTVSRTFEQSNKVKTENGPMDLALEVISDLIHS